MVGAADHVRDFHVEVVHDDAQVVGGIAVGTEEHEVLDFAVLDGDAAENEVVEAGLAGVRDAEAERRGSTFCAPAFPLAAGEVATGAVVFPRAALLLGAGAFSLELLRGAEAGVGVAQALELRRHFAVAREPLGLAKRPFVPLEPQPLQAVEDGRDELRLRAVGVRVLDPEDEDSAVVPGEKPVVERGARAAHVEVTRRRGREADSNFGHVHCKEAT